MSFQDTLEQLKEFDVNNIDFEKIGVWPWPAFAAYTAGVLRGNYLVASA